MANMFYLYTRRLIDVLFLASGEWYKLVHVKKKLDDLVHVQGKTLPQHNNISGEQINLDSKIETCS